MQSTAPLKPAHHSHWLLEMLDGHFNWINDKRWNWAPFFHLRPRKHEFVGISTILIFAALCFGPVAFAGAVFTYWFATVRIGLSMNLAVWFASAAFVLSLLTAVTHQYVSFHFWNRRADRIRCSPNFRLPADDTILGPSNSTDTNNPFQAPRVPFASLDPTQVPPLRLRNLAYAFEVIFVVGTVLSLPYWLSITYPTFNLSGTSTIVACGMSLMIFFCNCLISNVRSSQARAVTLVAKLAIAFCWLFLSLLLIAIVLLMMSDWLLPLIVTGWAAVSGIVIVMSSLVRYFVAMRQFEFDAVGSKTEDVFGWNTQ